jgi:hypothetical protein|tara:strand:- start:1716 stop:1907 length:192 start_codon:yes stop_codon:yes gene_type:complete
MMSSDMCKMSDEFHDWLEKCPVQWFRGAVSKGHVAYYFETPDKDVNDEENEDEVFLKLEGKNE